MGRLIYADKLCESLIENISWLREQDYETYCAVGDAIVFVTDQQPTAYDPNKVVKQLNDKFRVVRTDEDLEWNRAMDEAITIVNGGGVDGN